MKRLPSAFLLLHFTCKNYMYFKQSRYNFSVPSVFQKELFAWIRKRLMNSLNGTVQVGDIHLSPVFVHTRRPQRNKFVGNSLLSLRSFVMSLHSFGHEVARFPCAGMLWGNWISAVTAPGRLSQHSAANGLIRTVTSAADLQSQHQSEMPLVSEIETSLETVDNEPLSFQNTQSGNF